VTPALRLLVAVLFVVTVGTANAGGYRFGVSDQAFYVPSIELAADSTLFPRDRGVFEPQMRLWLGDELLGAAVRATGIELPTLFAVLYLLTMCALTIGVVALARTLGCDWWTIAAALVLVTLRHRIARTGANSLEGYMHPRMLAFALGLVALAFSARLKPVTAAIWTLLAALVHTSTAIWFGGVVFVAALWPYRLRRDVRLAALAAAVAGVAGFVGAVALLPRMDAGWLAVLDDRDYLFSADWPLYAWLGNLAYPAVLWTLHRRRTARGVAHPGESALIAGLLALVVVFLVTIPLAELHIAFFVQLQANRIFWLLDVVVAIYVAWWLASDRMSKWPSARRAAAVGVLACLAIGRGVFVLHEAGRPLVQVRPPTDDWMDTMTWLRGQPAHWHVLVDPGHAWKYGISVRAAALRDTPLEIGKDPAMAMYDRRLAMRVADRTVALGNFDAWSSPEEVLQIAAHYEVDVFVDHVDRRFPFPVLFRNNSFVVYDLR
jgi:hypothetical protein